MNKVIVENLETNISAVLDGLRSIGAVLEQLGPEALELNKQLIAEVSKIKLDNVDVCENLDKVRASVDKIKFDFPEISFDKEAKNIVEAVSSLRKTLIQKDFSTTVNIDTSALLVVLEKIAGSVSQKMEMPTEMALPQEQLEQLLAGLDQGEQKAILENIQKAIKNIRVSGGGGGPDVVGLKKTLPSGQQVQINPASEETLGLIAGTYYDSTSINTADSSNIVIEYKKSGVTVATETIAISGSVINIIKS